MTLSLLVDVLLLWVAVFSILGLVLLVVDYAKGKDSSTWTVFGLISWAALTIAVWAR